MSKHQCWPQLTRGIEKTVAGLVTKLRELGTEVTDEALADVATVSAGNNRVVRRCAVSAGEHITCLHVRRAHSAHRAHELGDNSTTFTFCVVAHPPVACSLCGTTLV